MKVGDKVQYKGIVGTIQGFAVGNDERSCYVVDCPDLKHRTNLFPIEDTVEYAEDTMQRIMQDAKNVELSAYNWDNVLEVYWGCNSNCVKCPVRKTRGKAPYELYPYGGAWLKSDVCRRAITLDLIERTKKVCENADNR